jgi:uncharacterized protein (DUF433 family)
MSKVVGIRLAEQRFAELQRAARAVGRTPSELAGRLVEEGLRQRAFPGIDFRDTPIGRQAFLAGTRLGVWHIALIAPEYGGRADDIGAGLGVAPSAVAAALAYAGTYPDEITAAIEDSAALNRRVAALVAVPGMSVDGE